METNSAFCFRVEYIWVCKTCHLYIYFQGDIAGFSLFTQGKNYCGFHSRNLS